MNKYKEQLTRLRKIVPHWFLGFILISGLVALFTELAEDVWFREGFAWDAPIILAIHRLSSPVMNIVMKAVTLTGGSVAIILAIVLFVWFARKRDYLNAATIAISLSGGAALNSILKVLLSRPRPSLFPPMVFASGFSFPSGHVAASVAVYGFLAVLLWRHGHRGFTILSGAWVLVVAVSRIYLGVHYPSDALGAIAFSTIWLMLVFVVRDAHLRSVNSHQSTGKP
jgi:membrane-associated phospholipid phosphatase